MKLLKSPKLNEALDVILKLEKAGFTSYLAGGCVRDLLLGRVSQDYDIATKATPNEIEKLFKKTKGVGKQYGVILVIGKAGHFEVATFRGESEYEDARRPNKIHWVSAKEDARRRDFSINGLFYEPKTKKIIDYVSGQNDLKNKIIRFFGNPDERICEDHLRILRAVRFKNVLDFKYAPETERAIKENAKKIKTVSLERIKDELDKILTSEFRAQGILDLSNLGIMPHILPEIDEMKKSDQPPAFHAEGNVFKHTILCLEKLAPDVSAEVAWAILLHDIGKPAMRREIIHPQKGKRTVFYGHVEVSAKMTEQICHRLKFSKKEKDVVVFLVREHLKHKDIPKMKLARQRQWVSHPLMPELLQVWKADGQGSWLSKKEHIDLSLYDQVKKIYEDELKRPKPPKPFLSGDDVMKALKIPPGLKVGEILRTASDAQLEEKVKNKKEALQFIKNLK